MRLYKYIEYKDVVFHTNLKHREFRSEWMEITTCGHVIIKGTNKVGYSWDGCSPKFRILDLLFGTPDGAIEEETGKPITYYASMLHDALYQYKKEVYVSRLESDKLFYAVLKNKKYFWSGVYYAAVRVFGWIMGRWEYKRSFQSELKIKKIVI